MISKKRLGLTAESYSFKFTKNRIRLKNTLFNGRRVNVMITYFIIGTVLFTFTSIRMAIRDIEKMKSNIRNPLWWVATVACVIFWPLVLGWAIYDGVRIIKDMIKEGVEL